MSQTALQVPTPPVAPAAQAGAAAPAPATTVAPAIPSLDVLRSRRSELSTQLNSASGRREELLKEMRRAPEAAQSGIKLRLDVLDNRLVQLETDIAENGRQMALLGGEDTQETSTSMGAPFGMPPGNVTAISIVFTIFVLFPVAIAAARLLWKRGNRPIVSPASRDADLRMERVEQAVDAIAVEVERISEGQRFVTQLLSRQTPALGVGPAEPLKVPLNETVMAGAHRQKAG